MPIQPTYPGVYIEEVPSGVRTIAGVSTSVTAFVGYTAKGPVNKAVRVFNPGDYKRQFGGLHHDSLVSYAVQQFFQNGGNEAVIVRVASGAAKASVKLKDPSENEVLTVSAASEGAWGNDLRLDVDYNTSNPDSTFNLKVTRYELRNGLRVVAEEEMFRNLSMSERSSTYVKRVVDSASKLIRLERAAVTFEDHGYSLSKDLSDFGSLMFTDEVTNLTGVLDHRNPFTLVLEGDPPEDKNELVTAINNAIGTAGLSMEMEVVLANADGADNAGAGNYIKIKSKGSDFEHSSVVITRAPYKDLAPALGFGLRNGGREKEGASTRRPAVSGTLSDDLAIRMSNPVPIDGGHVTVKVRDHSSGDEYEQMVTFLESVDIPTARDNLQGAIRSVVHPATQNAVVELNATFLRVIPSGNVPNVSIELSGDPVKDGQLRLGDDASGAFYNLRRYSLGTGAEGRAQTNPISGGDGDPPGVDHFLGDEDAKTGIHALRDVDLFNILSIPATSASEMLETDARSIIDSAIAFCEEMRAFYLVDYPRDEDFTSIIAWVSGIGAQKNAAVYFPRVLIPDPLDGYRLRDFPSSGVIAGLFARIDEERGVWKAPAGLEAGLSGVQGLTYKLTDPENGVLNKEGINCLRTFPGAGTICWGARTLEGAEILTSEWKYVPIRRLALFLEESHFRGTKWVVFEPNDEPLWAKIRMNLRAFMMRLFRQGAFQGSTPDKAFYVKCDAETTPQEDRDLGIVNIEVGFAPLKPAEFVIIKIQQMAGQV